MGLERRMTDLERAFSTDAAPMSKQEALKWFTMFADERGAGHATSASQFTPEEWEWFREGEGDFIATMNLLSSARERAGRE